MRFLTVASNINYKKCETTSFIENKLKVIFKTFFWVFYTFFIKNPTFRYLTSIFSRIILHSKEMIEQRYFYVNLVIWITIYSDPNHYK